MKLFTILKTVSNTAWSSIDKSKIWQLLKDGITGNIPGTTPAIKEVYAVVKADINPNLTETDCWGTHHEVNEDGTVVLNKNGLFAMVEALGGARTKPDLTPEQIAEAEQHAIRHYRELNLPLPDILKKAAGEMIALRAIICGEMTVDDIPLNPGVDLKALKAGDSDPMEVVVEVPTGKSKRGWDYKPQSLQAIVGEVMQQGLPGFLGHQKAENVATEFPDPVTHWVGAKWENGKAYFRGVIDKTAPDLKRWIRAKTIKTVSIFGMPKLQQVAGETHVVDYKPLSIDWTPLGRAGMPTSIVAIGEMDEIIGELDGSYEDLRDALQAAVKNILGSSDKNFTWVCRVYPDFCVVQREADAAGIKFYKIPYGIVDGKVQLGKPVEVTRTEIYSPVGELFTFQFGGVTGEMNWKELLAKLKAMVTSGEVTRTQIVGEMGWKVQELAGEIESKWLTEMTGSADTLSKVKEALGVTGEMDVLTVAKDAAEALKAKKTADHDKVIKDVLTEKVAGEMAQGLVLKMLHLPETATKELIAGEIDKLLADETLKDTFSKMHIDTIPVPGGTGGKSDKGNGMLKTRTVSI